MSRTRKDRNRFNMSVPSKFKLQRRRSRRRKEKLSLRKGEEVPLFKRSDIYDYW